MCCNKINPCNPPNLQMRITPPVLCPECCMKTLGYLNPRFTLSDITSLAEEKAEETCNRALRIMEGEVSIPTGKEAPFSFHVFGKDVKLLSDIYKYIDAVVLRKLPADAEGSQKLPRLMNLLRVVGSTIEASMLAQVEKGLLALQCVLLEQTSSFYPGLGERKPLFKPIDVIDLPRDKRKCSLCKENYIAKEGEVRVEEKPVQLPCGHVYGRACLLDQCFDQYSLTCPHCGRDFEHASYLIEWTVEESPWWVKHIRGEHVA